MSILMYFFCCQVFFALFICIFGLIWLTGGKVCERETEGQAERGRGRGVCERETERQAERGRGRERASERAREKDRQTDKECACVTERQTRHIPRHRETLSDRAERRETERQVFRDRVAQKRQIDRERK